MKRQVRVGRRSGNARHAERALQAPRAALALAALVVASFAWLVLVAPHAAAQAVIAPDDVEGPFAWGAATRVTHLSHLYFADQPDAAGFELAKQAGVTTVIDLRAPGERDWEEQPVVEALGLAYYNVPVTGPDFDAAAFERIEALVAARPHEPILVHCSTSNRVGGWLATHLVTRHGLSEADALAVGRRAGITKQEIVDRVDRYLEARANAAPAGSSPRPAKSESQKEKE